MGGRHRRHPLRRRHRPLLLPGPLPTVTRGGYSAVTQREPYPPLRRRPGPLSVTMSVTTFVGNNQVSDDRVGHVSDDRVCDDGQCVESEPLGSSRNGTGWIGSKRAANERGNLHVPELQV